MTQPVLDDLAIMSRAKWQTVLADRTALNAQKRASKLPMTDLQSVNSGYGMIVVTRTPILNLVQWVLSGGLLGGLLGTAQPK